MPMGNVARYQDVQTAVAFRDADLPRRCSRPPRARCRAARYAIMSAAGSDAARVYTRVGFRVAERTRLGVPVPAAAQWMIFAIDHRHEQRAGDGGDEQQARAARA